MGLEPETQIIKPDCKALQPIDDASNNKLKGKQQIISQNTILYILKAISICKTRPPRYVVHKENTYCILILHAVYTHTLIHYVQ